MLGYTLSLVSTTVVIDYKTGWKQGERREKEGETCFGDVSVWDVNPHAVYLSSHPVIHFQTTVSDGITTLSLVNFLSSFLLLFVTLSLLIWLISCVLFLSSLVTFFLLSLYFCGSCELCLVMLRCQICPLCLVYFICVLLCFCPCFCLSWSTTIDQTKTNLYYKNYFPVYWRYGCSKTFEIVLHSESSPY